MLVALVEREIFELSMIAGATDPPSPLWPRIRAEADRLRVSLPYPPDRSVALCAFVRDDLGLDDAAAAALVRARKPHSWDPPDFRFYLEQLQEAA